MLEVNKPFINFEMPELFGRIDVNSYGDKELELICVSNKRVAIRFTQFLNVINYTEWFYNDDRLQINIPKSNENSLWR
jgi:hypothetical protein